MVKTEAVSFLPVWAGRDSSGPPLALLFCFIRYFVNLSDIILSWDEERHDTIRVGPLPVAGRSQERNTEKKGGVLGVVGQRQDIRIMRDMRGSEDTVPFGPEKAMGLAAHGSQSQPGSDILERHVEEPHAVGWNGANARDWGSALFLGFEVLASCPSVAQQRGKGPAPDDKGQLAKKAGPLLQPAGRRKEESGGAREGEKQRSFIGRKVHPD